MTVARSVADVLADHVVFEVESIDRMYLNCAGPSDGVKSSTWHALRALRAEEGPTVEGDRDRVVTRIVQRAPGISLSVCKFCTRVAACL
jgi:hypothetical protein